MLLQFSVENFLSFREPQVLSMLAAEDVDHPPHMVMEGPDGKKVLRCAAVYGANASGKSNLVKALEFATRLALKGARPGEKLSVAPFRLCPVSRDKPTSFQWELDIKGAQHSYGLVVSPSGVESEWLFAGQAGAETLLFRRENGVIRIGEGLAQSAERSQFLRFLAEGTRPNQPFLAEARERNAQELSAVWDALEGQHFIRPDRPFTPLLEFFDTHPDFKEFASSLLAHMGTGVESIEKHHVGVVPEEIKNAHPGLRATFVEMMNIHLRETASGAARVSEEGSSVIMMFRRASDGRITPFGFTEESDGTQRLVHLAPALYLRPRTSARKGLSSGALRRHSLPRRPHAPRLEEGRGRSIPRRTLLDRRTNVRDAAIFYIATARDSGDRWPLDAGSHVHRLTKTLPKPRRAGGGS